MKKVRFPKDSFPHRSVIEWWYFNGNLADKKGNKYAFMNCLFKADPKKTDIPIVEKIPVKRVYFSHSVISDITNKRHRTFTHPISIISKDSFTKKNLFINYFNPSPTGYVNNEIIETGKFSYKIKNGDFDLTLTAKKKPFLHNGTGYLSVNKKKIYYYSLTDLEVKGVIRFNNKWIDVKGKGWMDHEWSEFSGKKNWNWFSVQLDNGMDIMIQDYNNKENTYVGIIHKNQKTECTNEVMLMPKKKWRSHFTGASYPIEWKIKVPSKNISLKIKAPIPNQEILFGSLNYWEGPIEVSGEINNKKVRGKGFMELAGRKMHKSKLALYNHELRKEASLYLRLAKKEMSEIWDNYWRK